MGCRLAEKGCVYIVKLSTKRKLVGTGFISPWIIGFLLFFLVPLVQTLVFSLNTVNITPEGYSLEAEGFSNFLYAFRSDAEFPKILLSSVTQLVTDVPFILAFSFFISVVLNQPFPGNRAVKLVFFLTVILSTGVFQSLQSQSGDVNTGQLNTVLQENSAVAGLIDNFRVETYMIEAGLPAALAESLTAPMMRLFSILSSSGIQIFIFLAALKTIPPSLYESSYMEGATGWEAFWKITFPMVSPMILVNVVYTVIDSFLSPTNQALNYVKKTIFTNLKFGYGSALAWIYFVIISVILAVVVLLISRKTFYYDK